MDKKAAAEIVDNYFTFDDVGTEMSALRKNVDDTDKQKALAEALVAAAMDDDDVSEDDRPVIEEAAKERVEEYVASVKSTRGTGCGR